MAILTPEAIDKVEVEDTGSTATRTPANAPKAAKKIIKTAQMEKTEKTADTGDRKNHHLVLLPPGLRWTPQDVFCSSLFGPWDDLPCRDYHGQTSLLRDLDRIISLFDARIQHSDAGFRAWRARHKQAMEAGLAEVPGFPNLGHARPGGRRAWQDDVWEQRYHYLVFQRHHMILARLDSRFMLSHRERDAFFGRLPATPRDTLRGRARGAFSRPLALRCDWHMPLDALLSRAARNWDMDTDEVKAQFWRDEAPFPVPTLKVKEEEEEGEAIHRKPPTRLAAAAGEKGTTKPSSSSCGKMDIAYLLADDTQLAQGPRPPHVSLQGQVNS
ncbi:hypothetical protein ESCO_004737 [Escovopsis weberi]|uniref:Uncharacterized protein n=1 Tax=Escovopsis weberi TaxID=150374 RepID=A0A0M8MZV2_ESCWE|nr:hypothetical protein ESCO_004737 [Escovopsis weberi]